MQTDEPVVINVESEPSEPQDVPIIIVETEVVEGSDKDESS